MTYATTTFGPVLWHTGHLLAANFSDNTESDKRTQYLAFFESFGYLLPCSWCRFYYQSICELMPLSSYINKADGVSRWFYLVHDLVNKKNQFRERLCLEKCMCSAPQCTLTHRTTVSSPPYVEVRAMYDDAKMTKPIKTNTRR